jgi:trimeric autotransporter adhesin
MVRVVLTAAPAGVTVCGEMLICIPARRRGWRAMLGMLMLLALLTGGLSCCGGGRSSSGSKGSGSGNFGTTAGTYTVTVTGASGSTIETTAVTLTVN